MPRAAACCENGVDESQPLRRGMLGRPAAEDEQCRAGSGDPPELRTAHAAGGAERFDRASAGEPSG